MPRATAAMATATPLMVPPTMAPVRLVEGTAEMDGAAGGSLVSRAVVEEEEVVEVDDSVEEGGKTVTTVVEDVRKDCELEVAVAWLEVGIVELDAPDALGVLDAPDVESVEVELAKGGLGLVRVPRVVGLLKVLGLWVNATLTLG